MIGGSPQATARSVWMVRGESGPSWSGSPEMTWAQVASTVLFADGGAGAVVIGGRAAAAPLDDAELAGADCGPTPQREREDDGDRDGDRGRDEGVAASAGVDGVPATGGRPGRSASG